MKILIDEKNRKYVVPEGKDEVHTHYGVVSLKDVPVNSRVKSHLGREFAYIEGNTLDLCEKLPRTVSTVLRKDFGAIIANTGIGGGSRVIEAGTGSGAVSIALANIVKPAGKVYTYEIREDFFGKAKQNIELSGFGNFVEMRLKDIREGIEEKEVDAVILDMPDPWSTAKHAYEALKWGGFIAAYSPYIEQSRKTTEALKEAGFRGIKTLEMIEREMEIKDVGIRPRTRMLGHTAYLTFGRKY